MTFLGIDPQALSRRDRYALVTACVIPRPVGWASTISNDGKPNLAPFSFFAGVTSDPFTVMLSVGRRGTDLKDTAKNLLDTREAVLHIPTRPLAERMVETSAEVAADVDEFELAALTKVPANFVRPFRVLEAPLSFEARVVSHQEVGRGPVDVFFLEVIHVHVASEVVTNGLPDARKLVAVGRLGGVSYCDTADTFEISRAATKR